MPASFSGFVKCQFLFDDLGTAAAEKINQRFFMFTHRKVFNFFFEFRTAIDTAAEA